MGDIGHDGLHLVTAQTQHDDTSSRRDRQAAAPYAIPREPLRLSGPVERPAPGALPLRGDLAHIALAHRYLVQNYVCPMPRTIAAADAPMLLHPHDDAEQVVLLSAGSTVELLDQVGAWAWVCRGPDGPAGFVQLAALTPAP